MIPWCALNISITCSTVTHLVGQRKWDASNDQTLRRYHLSFDIQYPRKRNYLQSYKSPEITFLMTTFVIAITIITRKKKLKHPCSSYCYQKYQKYNMYNMWSTSVLSVPQEAMRLLVHILIFFSLIIKGIGQMDSNNYVSRYSTAYYRVRGSY